MFKLDLEKTEEPEITLPTSIGSSKKKESAICVHLSLPSFFFFLKQKKQFQFCFLDYAKAFDCVDHNKLWKTLQEMGIPDYLTYLLRNLYAGQEESELDMEQQTGSI